MTDKEIIKALKHCYEHKSCNDCVGCLGAEECILNIDPAGDIYPIIKRQQAEIENSVEATKHWHREAELNAKEIIRLQAEIEKMHKRVMRLDSEREEWSRNATTEKLKNIELQAEIERLEELLDCSVSSERNTVDNIPYERAEAIKEFWSKLKIHSRKMQSSDFSGEFWDKAVLVEDGDNLEKEMVGE